MKSTLHMTTNPVLPKEGVTKGVAPPPPKKKKANQEASKDFTGFYP